MAKLQKKLGLIELVFFGIGAIVGTGIFVIPAISAKIADVASFWVWLELGVLTIFMAMCFAELASIFPNAGGPYKFVKEAFGPYFGFLSGWVAWIISWLTISSLSIAIPFYISFFIPLTHLEIDVIALSLLSIITFWNFKGLHWGVKAQYLFTSISILVLWFFVTWGIYWVDASNYVPSTHVNLSTLFFAAVFVIEPFIGWETITYFGEEAKHPKRDLPRAIIYSSVFVTVLYSAVIFVTMGVLKGEQLKQTYYPIAEAAGAFLGHTGAALVALGAIAVLMGCLNSWIVSTARLPYAIARDGLFPKVFARVHEKNAVPHMALLLQYVFSIFAVLIATYEGIIYVLVSMAMVLYLLVFTSIPANRKKVKEESIGFKLPLDGLIPLIASLVAIFVLFQVNFIYLVTVGVILIGGSLFYLYFSRRK